MRLVSCVTLHAWQQRENSVKTNERSRPNETLGRGCNYDNEPNGGSNHD